MTSPFNPTNNTSDRYSTTLNAKYNANPKALANKANETSTTREILSLPLPAANNRNGVNDFTFNGFSQALQPAYTTPWLQAPDGSLPMMYTDAKTADAKATDSQPTEFKRLDVQRRNTKSKEGLSQFNRFGENVAQGKDYNGAINLNQLVRNGQNQEAYFNGVQGNININQEGKSNKGNEIVLNNVSGSANLQSFNAIGDVYIEGTNMKGQVVINASTNPTGLNKIDLKEVRLGATIRSLGSSDITIDKAEDNIDVNVKGRQGLAEDYRVKVSNVKSDKINNIRIEGQKEDSAWVNLTGNTNSSEVFLQGIGNTVFIEGKNNQKDVIHVEGEAIVDLTQLDGNDTIITHLADGSSVSKSVAQLNELKLLRTMTPEKATQLLKNNFGAFESLLDTDKNRKDNIASFDELVAYTKLPTTDPSLKAAAQYYINNRTTTFDVAEGINTEGRKDNVISMEDLARFSRVSEGSEAMPNLKTDAEFKAIDDAEAAKKAAEENAKNSMTALKATTILKDNFSAFESLKDSNPNRKDNVAQFDELVAYTKLSSADPLVKAAAQFFIDNRAMTFDKMEGLQDNGRKDSIFSLDEMTKFETSLKSGQAARILANNFRAFESLKDGDPNRKDNIASFEEIVAYSQQANLDPTIKAATQFFIDNRRESFDIAEGLNAGLRRDGIISFDEMDKFATMLGS